MGILLISILLMGLGVIVALFEGWLRDNAAPFVVIISALLISGGAMLSIYHACEHGDEKYNIETYDEVYRLSQVKTDDFTTACYIKAKVVRVNARLEKAKAYNNKNDFMFGIFKQKTFANYDYINFDWNGNNGDTKEANR